MRVGVFEEQVPSVKANNCSWFHHITFSLQCSCPTFFCNIFCHNMTICQLPTLLSTCTVRKFYPCDVVAHTDWAIILSSQRTKVDDLLTIWVQLVVILSTKPIMMMILLPLPAWPGNQPTKLWPTEVNNLLSGLFWFLHCQLDHTLLTAHNICQFYFVTVAIIMWSGK